MNDEPARDGPKGIPLFVDWLLGALIAVFGLLLLLGGSALEFLVDREAIEQEVRADNLRVVLFNSELSAEESVTVVEAVLAWAGIGVMLVGICLILFGIGYIVVRHRTHQAGRAGEPVSHYWGHAVLGAVTTTLLSFIPFSQVIGGALAGYLERRESERAVHVGALSGLLPAIPVIAIMAFVMGGFVDGLLRVGEDGFAAFLGVALVFAAILVAILSAGFGALGGYLGGWFHGEATGGGSSPDAYERSQADDKDPADHHERGPE